MKIFKDPSNKVHNIEKDFEYLLPKDCVEIDQAEANILLAPINKTAQEIDAEKEQQSLDIINSPLAVALIEQFTFVFQDNNIPMPADFIGKVKDSVKSNL